jgi:hypothetical protein
MAKKAAKRRREEANGQYHRNVFMGLTRSRRMFVFKGEHVFA